MVRVSSHPCNANLSYCAWTSRSTRAGAGAGAGAEHVNEQGAKRAASRFEAVRYRVIVQEVAAPTDDRPYAGRRRGRARTYLSQLASCAPCHLHNVFIVVF